MMQYESGILGKWLAMLKEVAPHLTRAAFVANPKFKGYDYSGDLPRRQRPHLRSNSSQARSATSPMSSELSNRSQGSRTRPPRSTGCYDHRPPRSLHFTCCALPLAGRLSLALLRRSRRTHVLRN